MSAIPKPRREIDTKYTRWIKGKACLLCAEISPHSPPLHPVIDPHHVKPKGGGIMGSKVSDRRCVPLCRTHHGSAESYPDVYRDLFERSIVTLNREYDAQHKPAKPVKERKVSPTVQHLLIRCECQRSHRIPSSKVSQIIRTPAPIQVTFHFYCPILKGWLEAKFRMGA